MTKRSKLIAFRWLSIILYSIVGAAIVHLMIKPLALATISNISIENYIELIAFEALCIGAVIWIMSSLKLLQWKVFTPTFAAHPPLWVSIVFGLTILTQPYSVWMYAVATSVTFIITFLTLGIRWQKNPAPEKIEDLPEYRQDIDQWESHKIISWANEELPLYSKLPQNGGQCTKLLFGHEKYVCRIFNRIIVQTGLDRDSKSLALIGELGSGKSSIINTLISLLNSGWIAVKVDAWARSANTVDEQILDLVIDDIGKSLDVTAYRRLPHQYHSALQSLGGWWSTLSQLSSESANTKSKLQRIDNLLLMIDKRILIIIEDPDRGEVSEVEQRKQRILALIDRLQQHTSNRIKVILTGGKDILSNDYRVIEYKEILQTPSEDFAKILQKVSDEIWCALKLKIVLPNGTPSYSADDFPHGTPRDFKHIIRDINTLWQPQELMGEIDLKTLVLLTFAKERIPEIGHYYSLYIDEKMQPDFFDQGISSRCLYEWGSSTFSTNTYSNEHLNLSTLSLFHSGEKKIDQLSKSLAFRAQLDNSKSAELSNWTKRLSKTSGFQTIFQAGRTNYLKRFLLRSPYHFAISDLEASSLLPNERLRDQRYFQAMNNIQERLRKGKPLEKCDLELLLYTGQQSPYLYWRMRGEDTVRFKNEAKSLTLECWEALAQGIITLTPSLAYSPCSQGHPAARHLLEIIKFLSSEKSRSHFDSKAIDTAFSVASKAMNCPCSTMGTLMHEILQLSEFIKLRHDKARLWPLLRSAILNDYILPKNIETAEQVSWQLIISLERKNSIGDNTQGLYFLDLLNTHCKSSSKKIGNDDIEALLKVISTFRQLQKYGEKDLEYRSYIPEHEAKWKNPPSERVEHIKVIESFINKMNLETEH